MNTTLTSNYYITYFGNLAVQSTIINTTKYINRTSRQKINLSLYTIGKNTINVR